MSDGLTPKILREQARVIQGEWEKRTPKERLTLWTSPATVRCLHLLADKAEWGTITTEQAAAYLGRWANFIIDYVRLTINHEPHERLCIAVMRLNRLCDELGTTVAWIVKGEQQETK